MTAEKAPNKSTRVLKRIGRILLRSVLILILLVITLLILIQTPPVQNFIVKKATAFLEKKLKTEVAIGRLYIGFPKDVILEDVYVEDLNKDTLLAGGRLKVDISMLKLLYNEIEINSLKLDRFTAKVSRTLPDTTYNFQFIIDAFAGEKKVKDESDTASLNMNVKYVQLDKIRLVYKDVITGNDVDLWLGHFDTNIDKFDLSHQAFDIPVINISDIRAQVYQSKPLMTEEPLAKDMEDAKAAPQMQLNLRKVLLSKMELDYRNDVSAMYTSLNLGQLEVNVDELDLQKRFIDLKSFRLDNTIVAINLGKKEGAKVVEKEVEQELASQAQNDWRVMVGTIRINNNDLKFDNDNKPRERYGMDYAHLKADDLTLHINNLLYSKDSMAGIIAKGEMKEQSGFTLNKFETRFLYAANEASLTNLDLQTPGTHLRRSVILRYPSIASLKDNLGALRMDVELLQSKIQVKDILLFAPTLRSQPALSNPNSTLRINTRLTGSVARLNIQTLQLQGFNDTKVNVRGTVTGLPEVKKASGNLVITELTTSRRDIILLAPKGSLPATITIPERIRLSGRIAGGMNNVSPDLLVNTTLGNVSVKGNVKNPSDLKKIQYNAVVEMRNLSLGTILQKQDQMGALSARFTAKGSGVDPKTANASISGVIHSAVFKNYNYRDLQLTASIANQQLKANAGMHDPNIDFSLNASGSFSGKFPAIKVTADIDSIKTFALHLTTDTIIYRGMITADFPVTDPDHLSGDLLVTKSLLVQNDQRLEIDTLQIAAGSNDSGQYVRVNADALFFELHGQYRLTQLGAVFQQAIHPYFAMSAAGKAVKVDPYDFSFSGTIINKPILKTFLPALEKLDPVVFKGRFATTDGWSLNMNAPQIIYGANRIDNLQFQAGTEQNTLVVKANIQQLSSGKSIALFSTTLDARIANNVIDFIVNIKDKAEKNKYRIGASFAQPEPETYTFSIRPQELLLNYDPWVVTGDNLFTIAKTGINARHFVLSRSNQQLRINSQSQDLDAPMEVAFDNFKVSTLANFVQSDSLLVDGTLNGKVLLNNLVQQPTFTSDLTISDVSIKKDTIGTVNIQVNNTVQNTFAANVKITGRGNDVQLTGNYYVKPESNSSFDLNLDIRQILLSTVQGATMGAITNASGALQGKFAINGTVKAPSVNGNIDFKQAAFNLAMLNSYFRIDDESIKVNNEGVQFSTFTIKDSAGNTAVLDGMVYYNPGYTDYRFDLSLTANNFRALNTTRQVNQVYYGQLFFNSDLRIKGTQLKPVVEGAITINEQTKLTVILPQKEPGLQEREGIVEFVDMNAVPNDSLFMARYDSINKSDLTGFDIHVDINVDKLAEFNMVIDEGNGDFLKVRGEAALSGGIDQSGKITLAGSYVLEEGAYELSFNFLRRRFDIQKGSTIVWTGEPTKANVDITAVYVAKTAPLDLVGNQLTDESQRNFLRQRLPFEVHLKMKGELLKPELSFDIILPTNQNYNIDKNIITTIETKLGIIRQEPSEMNKQVFALLLLGRFISENPFASSGSGLSAESFARNSVSQILTEQLNNLASDLIKGVDINFGVESTTDDYITGQRQNRTDLNVALSKRLLNDRLTVTIGSNFELEGAQGAAGAKQRTNNLAGNVSIAYQLSKDGRYAIRAYRKNEYEGVLEGYIIETGVGFVISLDYNRFSQIFMSKEEREQKREIKKQQKQEDAQDKKKAEVGNLTTPEADDRKKAIKTSNDDSHE